jgi:predicted Zn finger-like uncharacterized protein
MKAQIAKIQLDVDYKCPNCYLHFRLSNSKVPQNRSCSVECPSCMQKLTIEPLFKVTKKEKTIKQQVDPVIKSAKAALKVLGFSGNETQKLIEENYFDGITKQQLIKEVLRNVEHA